MGRSIPTTPNHNTRYGMLSLIPLVQKVQLIRNHDLDAWGNDSKSEEPIWLDCKIQYSHQRFYLRSHEGHEREDTAYILVRGKVDVTTTDVLRYTFPDGDTIDYNVNSINHIFDMSGNIFLTKIWVK